MNSIVAKRFGQIGMEYILMFGLSLLIAGLIWVYASSDISTTTWELDIAYAKDAVSKMTETADMVHIQGSPAQFYISPTFPNSIRGAYISENSVILELHWKEGILRNISAEASVNLTGTLKATPGPHRILVRANNSNVEIRDG